MLRLDRGAWDYVPATPLLLFRRWRPGKRCGHLRWNRRTAAWHSYGEVVTRFARPESGFIVKHCAAAATSPERTTADNCPDKVHSEDQW